MLLPASRSLRSGAAEGWGQTKMHSSSNPASLEVEIRKLKPCIQTMQLQRRPPSQFAPLARSLRPLLPCQSGCVCTSRHARTGDAPHQNAFRARLQRHGHRLLRRNGHCSARLQRNCARQPYASCMRILAVTTLRKSRKHSPVVPAQHDTGSDGLELPLSGACSIGDSCKRHLQQFCAVDSDVRMSASDSQQRQDAGAGSMWGRAPPARARSGSCRAAAPGSRCNSCAPAPGRRSPGGRR